MQPEPIMLNQVQKFGRTVFRRASEITLFTTSLLLVSHYVGGLGLSLIFGASVVLWLLFNAYSVLPSHSRYLGALILSLVQFVFIMSTALPVLRSFHWINVKIISTYSIQERDYISHSRAVADVLHPWVSVSLMCFFTLCALPLIMISHRSCDVNYLNSPKLVKYKFRYRNAFQNTGPSIGRYVALIPLVAIAVLQYVNPIRAITFTMSGDARNLFLFVMRSRVNLSFPALRNMLQSGQLGETLATSITVTNGTTGFPRVADQYALRSVYLLLMCVIVCSVSVLITAHAKDIKGPRVMIRDGVVLVLAVFVVVSPYPMAEILRSGFLSFFVGLGFLVATLAFIVPENSVRRDVGVLAIICAVATFMSYQLISLLAIPIVSVLLFWNLWRTSASKIIKSSLVGFVVLGSLVATLQLNSLADQFSRRVRDGGAIQPTGIIWVGILFLLTVASSGVVRGRARYTLLCAGAITGSSLITLQLVVWARNDRTDPYGYYGYKLMYAINYISWFLLVALLGVFLSYLTRTKEPLTKINSPQTRQFFGKTVTAIASAVILTMSVSYFSSAKSPAMSVHDGWDSPTELIVAKTLDNWKSGNESYIFSNYATDSNDRLGNFWSPYFWEVNRWNWTYVGYRVDAEGLCSVIDGNKVLIITASQDLVRQVRSVCPEAAIQMSLEN